VRVQPNTRAKTRYSGMNISPPNQKADLKENKNKYMGIGLAAHVPKDESN